MAPKPAAVKGRAQREAPPGGPLGRGEVQRNLEEDDQHRVEGEQEPVRVLGKAKVTDEEQGHGRLELEEDHHGREQRHEKVEKPAVGERAPRQVLHTVPSFG